MDTLEKLLQNNKEWAAKVEAAHPGFFKQLEGLQRPEFLWIGCSDSRVPANEITGTLPGEIFVHRNVANLVVNTDLNLLTVLHYAVEVLQVKHIIICGHYGCGGVKAALTNNDNGLINSWLLNIKDIYRLHRKEVDVQPDEQSRFDKMVEINVREQVINLSKTELIQKFWKREQRPILHGWVYSLGNGILKPIVDMGPQSPLDPVYDYTDI